jgi:hypothetical protein
MDAPEAMASDAAVCRSSCGVAQTDVRPYAAQVQAEIAQPGLFPKLDRSPTSVAGHATIVAAVAN